MPRNFRGGNKTKRRKNPGKIQNNKSLRIKANDSLELYGKVIKRLGGNPPILSVLCEDGKERRCVVRGKFVKKVWMNPDDYILITCNTESGDSGEVSCKYNTSDVLRLEQLGELSAKTFGKDDEKNNITFTNDKDAEKKVDEYYSTANENKEPSTSIVFDEDEDFDFDDI